MLRASKTLLFVVAADVARVGVSVRHVKEKGKSADKHITPGVGDTMHAALTNVIDANEVNITSKIKQDKYAIAVGKYCPIGYSAVLTAAQCEEAALNRGFTIFDDTNTAASNSCRKGPTQGINMRAVRFGPGEGFPNSICVQAHYISGGTDGSCPVGSYRVQTPECKTLGELRLDVDGEMVDSFHAEDCRPGYTPGAGCFGWRKPHGYGPVDYLHLHLWSTASGCSHATGKTEYFAVCRMAEAKFGYQHVPKGCINGYNIDFSTGETVQTCSTKCSDNSACLGFGFGVEYLPESMGRHKAGDCLLKRSADLDCDGEGYNLDFYVK